MSTPEEMAGDVPEYQPPSPLLPEHHAIKVSVENLYAAIDKLWQRWWGEYLVPAKPGATDPDAYAKPVIVLAESFRHSRLPELAARAYEEAIQQIDAHEDTQKVHLHRGAIYANLAISHLEAARYDVGVSWLHAAAQEDIKNRGLTNPLDSYALSDDGIFGQFLNSYVLKRLPKDLVAFLDANVGQAHSDADLRSVYRWLAGGGDIGLISSIVEYDSVKGLSDPHSDSVRLLSLRDLAALFEVVWKRLGAAHKDPAVQAEFASAPTLAGLICHMHFQSDLKARRKNPALNANRDSGLLWNAIVQSPILDAVDREIDYCAGKGNSVEKVWNRLNTAPALSTDAVADAVARRFLLAYKLRNFTSHTFEPQDAGVKAHHEAMRLWLLQGIFFLYFWTKATGQV